MAARGRKRGSVAAGAFAIVVFALPLNAASAMTRAQARALGQAISLMPTDVPGFAASPLKPIIPTRTSRCGGHPGRALALVVSDAFTQQAASSFLEVNSTVTVQRRAAIAQHDLMTARGKHGRRCVARVIKRALRHLGLKRLTVSVTPLPPPVSGGVGMRVSYRGFRSGRPSTGFNDLLVFVRRSTEVGLATSSYPGTFPSDLERRLSDVLVARAKKDIP